MLADPIAQRLTAIGRELEALASSAQDDAATALPPTPPPPARLIQVGLWGGRRVYVEAAD